MDWTLEDKGQNFSEFRREYEFSPTLNSQILNKMH
jgi:hypothetical protein